MTRVWVVRALASRLMASRIGRIWIAPVMAKRHPTERSPPCHDLARDVVVDPRRVLDVGNERIGEGDVLGVFLVGPPSLLGLEVDD